MHVLLRAGSGANWRVPIVIGIIKEENLRETLEEVLADNLGVKYAEQELRRVGQWGNHQNTYYFAQVPQTVGS